MTRYQSASDAKEEHIEKLGNDLGSVFHELWNEVAFLYMKWDEYVQLFGKNPSRIKLLNHSAPTFFRIIQDTLWENILLHIARLTDPPISSGKRNLTIQCLPSLVDLQIKEKVSKQLIFAQEKTSFCRDWRNRKIAHNDFKLAIGEHAEPLNPVSRENVKDALKSIAQIMNTVSEYYIHSTIGFDDTIIGSGGAENLLYVIAEGIKAQTRRQERIQEGKFLPEDLEDLYL